MGSPNLVPNEGKGIIHFCLHSCNYFAFTESLLSYKLGRLSHWKVPHSMVLFSVQDVHHYPENIWLRSLWEFLSLDKCLLLLCLREHFLTVLLLRLLRRRVFGFHLFVGKEDLISFHFIEIKEWNENCW